MGTKRGSKVVAGAAAAGGSGAGEGEAGTAAGEAMNDGERLARELARVRAKFGMDPTDAREPLAEAWMSPTAAMEEDEAEFVDAVADCLGAGLPLEAALSCWHNDELAQTDEDPGGDDDDGAAHPTLTILAAHHAAAGRRLVIR
ncbi:MAG TPA: hypothetical protein VMU50_08825 [Polyangia bacterium]|nr:hypothetical protein [Polyangia bacterium]